MDGCAYGWNVTVTVFEADRPRVSVTVAVYVSVPAELITELASELANDPVFVESRPGPEYLTELNRDPL